MPRFVRPAILVLVLGGALGLKSLLSAASSAEPADESYRYTLLFARVVQLIRQDYVDGKKVGYRDLTYAALRGMLSSLDPHSQFLDEDDFQDIQRETKGEFSGLGIVVGAKDGALVIISPMANSPSGRAGLLPGDHILRIDGRSTEKMSLLRAMKELKGEPGQTARLTLLRPLAGSPTGGKIFEVQLTRETIRVASVADSKLLPATLTGQDKVGYVRIEEFSENTSEELDRALDKLQQAGMQSLVVDLRNNPGGLLDAAVDVAGKFVAPNTVIVSTRGRAANQNQEFRASPQSARPGYPMVVLINGYSASGAEIVAGALKDLRRALLVGETTFGKGSVQTVQALGDGVGLRLTTAKYYTPSKRTIHEVGIAPDISVPITDVEERRIVLSEEDRPLTDDEKSEVARVEDRQLDRAVSLLRALRIYDSRQPAVRQTAANPAPATSPR